MTAPELRRTALHSLHGDLGARFTDFGGWDMPLKYGNELTEHAAVREAAGLFDLSHMGEIRTTGPDAAAFLDYALISKISAMKVGKAKYSMICADNGGIIDDLITYRLSETEFLTVPNAGNADAVYAAFVERAEGFDVEVVNESAETAMIAVQGPQAETILREVVPHAGHDLLHELGYYAAVTLEVAGVVTFVARTGYTGEDGFELLVPNAQAPGLWQALTRAGADYGMIPCGLACRDTLRLEAGMPLYGNELSLELTPVDAGLGVLAATTSKDSFVGREAIVAAKTQGADRVLVGLVGEGRRAARGGYAVHLPGAEEPCGVVTSGALSPTLGHPIALAYVDSAHAEAATAVEVDIRGKKFPYTVVALPFYQRKK